MTDREALIKRIDGLAPTDTNYAYLCAFKDTKARVIAEINASFSSPAGQPLPSLPPSQGEKE